MTKVSYPTSWSELSQSPSARHELMQYLYDVSRWNAVPRDSGITDDLIGFFLDDYRISDGMKHLVGGLIFSDELDCAQDFALEFTRFFESQKTNDPALKNFASAIAPIELEEAAQAFLAKMRARGSAIFTS